MDRFLLSYIDNYGHSQESHCDGDELDTALMFLLSNIASDAKVTITYIGEEFDDSTD